MPQQIALREHDHVVAAFTRLAARRRARPAPAPAEPKPREQTETDANEPRACAAHWAY